MFDSKSKRSLPSLIFCDSLYISVFFKVNSLGMSTLAFIENTFRYALVMQISEAFFNVSFPGIGFLLFSVILRIG